MRIREAVLTRFLTRFESKRVHHSPSESSIAALKRLKRKLHRAWHARGREFDSLLLHLI